MSEFENFQATAISTDPEKAMAEPDLFEQKVQDLINRKQESAQKPVEPEPELQIETAIIQPEAAPVVMTAPQEQPKANPQPQPQQPQDKPVAQAQYRQVRPSISSNENGLIIAKNFDEEWRICSVLAASQMVPKGMNTPEKVFVARQFAAELKLPQMTALRNICVINGVPSLWGDLPLAMVRKSGLLEDFDEYWTDKDGNRLRPMGDEAKLFAAVCEVKRKGQKTQTFVFSEYDVKTARLDQKDIWKLYPRRMRQMRARSWALKDIFGDVLFGAAIAEYDFDYIPTEGGEVAEVDMNANKRRSAINDRFGNSEGSIQTPSVI